MKKKRKYDGNQNIIHKGQNSSKENSDLNKDHSCVSHSFSPVDRTDVIKTSSSLNLPLMIKMYKLQIPEVHHLLNRLCKRTKNQISPLTSIRCQILLAIRLLKQDKTRLTKNNPIYIRSNVLSQNTTDPINSNCILCTQIIPPNAQINPFQHIYNPFNKEQNRENLFQFTSKTLSAPLQ